MNTFIPQIKVRKVDVNFSLKIILQRETILQGHFTVQIYHHFSEKSGRVGLHWRELTPSFLMHDGLVP